MKALSPALKRLATLVVGVVLSGVLLTLALPLGDRGYLGWIAVVPLLRATRGRGFLVGFVAAIATMFVGAGVAISGAAYRERAPGLDAWIFTAYGLFGFAYALTVALWSDRNADRRPTFWFAAVATLLEAALITQLPANLALTQYRTQPVVLVAALAGVWGVSFLVWWANLALARLEIRRMLVVGAGCVAVGALLTLVTLPSPAGPRVEIGMVQSDTEDEKAFTELHLKASREGATVVVWPEFGGMTFQRLDGVGPLLAVARLPGSAPFVTSFRDDHRPLPHNVASIFSREGESARYFKRRLFGAESAMHAPGDFPASAKAGGHTYGLNICFDSCFPGILRDTVRLPGVEAILLPTIDPPSRHHFIAAMHAAYSPFRAAELGVPIIRADGYAYSNVVDANGRILATVAPDEAVAVTTVPLGSRFAPLRTLGDWSLGACAVAVVWPFLRRRKADHQTNGSPSAATSG